jgi:hypothetical protein
MRNLKLTLFIVVLVVVCLGGFNIAHALVITSVSRGGSSTTPPPIIAPNSLTEDELCFVDRTHQYNDIPTTLLRAEYVMVANDDKVYSDYSLNITLRQPARLFLFLDNRIGHYTTAGGDPNMNPDLWSAGMHWVYTMGFKDTGLNIGIDERGDGYINQWASVYVRKFQAGTVTLLQQNDLTNPTGRNMYGVAALMPKLFKAFWFDNGKLNLARTPGLLNVSSGFHAGPEWFWDESTWHSPFEIEDNSWGVSKWRPYIVSSLYWDVDVGGDETWDGGDNIWSFVTHLELQYTDPNVCPIHRWFFFWDNEPNGQGNCTELWTLDIGLPSPLDPNIMNHLMVRNETFIVNTKIRNVVSSPSFELIQTNKLEEHVSGFMPADDVQDFMSGDVISYLDKFTDPCGLGFVALKRTSWTHPQPSILVSTTGPLNITEGDAIRYGVSLREPPVDPVTVMVKINDRAIIKWDDYVESEYPLYFNSTNWNQQQQISVVGNVFMGLWGSSSDQTLLRSIAGKHFFDIWRQGKSAQIAHYIAGDPADTTLLPVTLWDKKTAGRGFAYTDINRDATTNLVDVGVVANAYLASTKQPLEIDIWDPDVMVGQGIGIEDGSASFDQQTQTWTVQAAGADIWGTSDQFHYVNRKMPAEDCQLTLTVDKLVNTHEWAKAGIMIREGYLPSDPHVSIYLTPERGVVFQYRLEYDKGTWSEHGGITAHHKDPVSLRLRKAGGMVTGHVFTDGDWKGVFEMPMPPPDPAYPAYIGLALTSHVEGTQTTATFGRDLVSLGPQPEPPD